MNMKNKQDILNEFREKFVVTKPDYRDPSLGFWKLDENGTYYRPEHVESWLFNTLTEFEREIKERIKLCAKEQSCSMCMESLSQLEKEKHPSK